jgi:hypothetical protein
MTLEEFTAKLNTSMFWKEFTFSQTRFSPRPKHQVELADGIVRIGTLAYVLQLKERSEETDDPQIERQWFRRKVLGTATRQIRDSVTYLSEQKAIQLTNEQGHTIDVGGSDLSDIKKIIIFQGGKALPKDCWATQFYISKTVGFIHILATHDYQGILNYLQVPEDIRRYFEYRESVLPRLRQIGTTVEEPEIMVGYLSNLDLPVSGSKERLRDFIQDIESADLTYIMSNLLSHIQNPDKNKDYYKILLEFARVPRSVWREFKKRLLLSLDACKAGEFCRPFRFTFPATDCTFMIASLDPSLPSVGANGERMRVNGLQMLTLGAKYAAKSKVGVGLLVSKYGEYVQLDWCLVDQPWEYDPQMEKMLATSNPFRPVSEKMVDSFFFRDAGTAR